MKKPKQKKEWKKMNKHKVKGEDKALNKFVENSKNRRAALEREAGQAHDKKAKQQAAAMAVMFFAVALLITFCIQKYIGQNMPPILQSEDMLYGR